MWKPWFGLVIIVFILSIYQFVVFYIYQEGSLSSENDGIEVMNQQTVQLNLFHYGDDAFSSCLESFDKDFLIPLHRLNHKSRNSDNPIRVTLVSEFYARFKTNATLSNRTLRDRNEMQRRQTAEENIHDNAGHARFVFLVSGEGSTSTFDAMQVSHQVLKNILENVPFEIDAEILFAPGGVTYRHLFAAAMRFEEAFLVHNSDIAVGDMSLLLDSCGPNLDLGALVGSRTDTFRHANATKPTCFEYMNMGSFDIFMTNRKGLLVKGDTECSFLNNLRFPQHYWGAENVVAFLLSTRKTVANLCSRWVFRHLHESKTLEVQRGSGSRDRPNRVRINHQDSEWGVVQTEGQNLSHICNLDLLPQTEDGNFTKPKVSWKQRRRQKLLLAEMGFNCP